MRNVRNPARLPLRATGKDSGRTSIEPECLLRRSGRYLARSPGRLLLLPGVGIEVVNPTADNEPRRALDPQMHLVLQSDRTG